MDVLNTWRIALLGKTGTGKSSLANTIFGKDMFKSNISCSRASTCQAQSGSVSGRSITLIDTPGFFDTGRSEKELKHEIVKCVKECAPGPHAFLIVLKVEKFTEQEIDVITQMERYFSAEAFKYAAVVFTHGDQLSEEKKIEEFVAKNKHLKDLVEKCGGRCHIVDNKYWKNNQQHEYRNNQFQVTELLNTIEKMVKENKGGCYTSEMLKEWEKQQEESIKVSSGSVISILKCVMKYARKTSMRLLLGVVVIFGVLLISKMIKDQAVDEGMETHSFL